MLELDFFKHHKGSKNPTSGPSGPQGKMGKGGGVSLGSLPTLHQTPTN